MRVLYLRHQPVLPLSLDGTADEIDISGTLVAFSEFKVVHQPRVSLEYLVGVYGPFQQLHPGRRHIDDISQDHTELPSFLFNLSIPLLCF